MFFVAWLYVDVVLQPRVENIPFSTFQWFFGGRVRQLPNVGDVMYPKSWHLQITTLARKTTLFVGEGVNGRKQSQQQKKIHKKMAHQNKRCWELGIQQLDPCCFPKVAVAPVTSLSFVLCYMVSSAQPGEVISPISWFSKDGCSWPPEMEKPRYNFHVPPRYLRHVSPGHLGVHKVFGHSWGEPVTWLRSKMCLFFKIKG